jgi:hypothetical protein
LLLLLLLFVIVPQEEEGDEEEAEALAAIVDLGVSAMFFLDCGMQGYVWIRAATSAFEAIS